MGGRIGRCARGGRCGNGGIGAISHLSRTPPTALTPPTPPTALTPPTSSHLALALGPPFPSPNALHCCINAALDFGGTPQQFANILSGSKPTVYPLVPIFATRGRACRMHALADAAELPEICLLAPNHAAQQGLRLPDECELEIADELCRKLVGIEDSGVGGDQAESGTLVGVFCAEGSEVLAANVAAECMAVGCQQDEVWRQGLLGVGPYGGGGVGLAVEAGSQVIVAAAMAVFGLGKGKEAVALGAEAEHVVRTRETVVSLAVVE